MRALLCLLALSCFSLTCNADAPRYANVDNLYANVARRVAAGEFESLLQEAVRYQKSQERLPDGRWKLAVFYDVLGWGYARAAHGEDAWSRMQSALATQADAHPTSSNAWLMLAALSESHAWAVRGSGYIDTVSPAGYTRFQELLEESRAVLYGHRSALADNPQWYAMRIAIGGYEGDAPAELDAVFAEAQRNSPGYQQTWFVRLNFLTPKWGGSVAQMVDFIVRSAQLPSATDGLGLTARLLRYADEDEYPDLVRQPGIDWAVVKKAYDDVLARFPVNFNAQYYVLEACGKSDKDETRHLLERVRADAPHPDLGTRAGIYSLCADWADGKIPGFALPDAITGQDVEIR